MKWYRQNDFLSGVNWGKRSSGDERNASRKLYSSLFLQKGKEMDYRHRQKDRFRTQGERYRDIIGRERVRER